jgi:hypothetical protein
VKWCANLLRVLAEQALEHPAGLIQSAKERVIAVHGPADVWYKAWIALAMEQAVKRLC